MIELRNRKVLGLPPAITAIVRIPQTAVVAGDQMIGIVRIDPDVVKVTMRAARNITEALAAVITGD